MTAPKRWRVQIQVTHTFTQIYARSTAEEALFEAGLQFNTGYQQESAPRIEVREATSAEVEEWQS